MTIVGDVGGCCEAKSLMLRLDAEVGQPRKQRNQPQAEQ